MRRRPLPSVREEAHVKSWRSVCKNDWATYALVASVGALTYANSLNGEFVHDDIPAIVSNGDVNGANSVLRIFKDDFWGTPMSDPYSHKSYRPLTTITFRVNYALCGMSAWWWHLVNVLLHAACCALVARTGVLIARLQRPFAALAALLFAVHPIHTEAVSGVVGRADVLACFFFLSSLLLYHGCSSRHRVAWSVVLAGLSMLAKETGLTALLFNVVFDLYKCWGTLFRSPVRWRWKGDNVWNRVSRGLLALVILAGVRLILLQGSLPAFSPQDNPPAFHPSFTVRLLTFCYLAAFNWWLLLCPWTLSHDWQMGSVPLVTTLWDYRNLLTGAVILTMLALCYRFFIDLELQRHTSAVAGFFLLVLPYLPASNLLVTVGFVVAERVLYIPSVGSVLLTVCGVQALWRCGGNGRRLVALGVAVVVAGGAARTVLRNQDWRTRETLLRADLTVLPHNAKLHYNFANFLKDIEQQENAIKHYQEALRLWPSYASAHNNLGTLEVWSGRAEHHFLMALRYNARHLNAHYNLARLYRKKNRIAEAVKMLERCITLEPRFVPAHVEMFLAAAGQEKYIALRRLLDLEPRNWEHYHRFGNWLRGRSLWPLSLKYYLSAVRVSYMSSRRTALPPLTAAAQLLRRNGQRMRLLHLLTRWQGRWRGAGGAAERAWRLKTELAGRAARYTRVTQTKSTCLHHSHLEVSPSSCRTNNNNRSGGGTVKANCRGSAVQDSIPVTNPQFKPTHNKSETKHKSCPIKNRSNGPDPFALVSDHLIKTYYY